MVDFFQAQAAQNSASSENYSDAIRQGQAAQNSASSENYSDAVPKRFFVIDLLLNLAAIN